MGNKCTPFQSLLKLATEQVADLSNRESNSLDGVTMSLAVGLLQLGPIQNGPMGGVIGIDIQSAYEGLMTFFDIFLLFSLYALGFYHLVLGGAGIITGAPLVYPMPYTFNRPGLYLLVFGVLGFSSVLELLGPFVAYALFAVLVVDLAYETIRPLVSPSIQVIGTSPGEIERDLVDSFHKLSLKYTGEYPHYRVLEPYARVDVRYRKRLGIGEVRVAPRSRKSLLARMADVIAKDLDGAEQSVAQRGYLLAIGVGIVLLGVAFMRLGVLIS